MPSPLLLSFENPGELDPQLIQLLGVNVKESASPIGFFGTGLKYALASLLRWGDRVEIQTGSASFTFETSPAVIRGREFELVEMIGRVDRRTLGFTTDLGKSWKPWMVYRELACNALDEGGAGAAQQLPRRPKPQAGLTRVLVEGESLREAHEQRAEFLLAPSRPPLASTDRLEIHPGPSPTIFYRGVRVFRAKEPFAFTFNILSSLGLSEDREASAWEVEWEIKSMIAQLDDEAIIEAVLRSEGPERNFDWAYITLGELFKSVRDRLQSSAASLHRSLLPRSTAEICPTCGKPF